jgi:quercetin dioxygenase-like cupin family protein
MFSTNLLEQCQNNTNYRWVLDTTKQMQLVAMNLLPKQEIGVEKHANATQYIRVEEGGGSAISFDENKNKTQEIILAVGDVVIIESKTYHNVVAGENGMKISTLYSPPQHPPDLIQEIRVQEETSQFSKDVLSQIREYINQSYKHSPLYELLKACKTYLDEEAFFFSDIFNMLLVDKGKRPGCLVQTNEDWPHPHYRSNTTTREDMLKYLGKGFDKATSDSIAYEYDAIYSQVRYSMLVTLRRKLSFKFPDLVLVEYNDYFFVYSQKHNPNFEDGDIMQKLGYSCPNIKGKKNLTPLTYSIILTDQDDIQHVLFTVKCVDDYDKIKTQLKEQVRKFGTTAAQYDFAVSYDLVKN